LPGVDPATPLRFAQGGGLVLPFEILN